MSRHGSDLSSTSGLARNRPMPSGARPHSAFNSIVAVVVALAGVFGAAKAGWLDKGEGGDGTALDELVTDTTLAAVDPAAPVDTSGGIAPEPTVPVETTPPTPPPTKGPPSQDNKAFMFVVGDSDALNLGPPLQRTMEGTNVVESTLHYKASSGLSRPDFYDWPKALVADMKKHKPDIVVVTFGGNDAQPMNGKGAAVGSAAWKKEYGKRVGQVMDYLLRDGRSVVWVGIPSAKGDAFRARQLAVRNVHEAEAKKRPKVVYVNAWEIFSGIDTDYADYIADPLTGEFKLCRQDDGFHLNAFGATVLAGHTADRVKEILRQRGAAI